MIKINAAVINLSHKDVIPNLARDNIDEKKQVEKIGYAIGKAIHQHFFGQGQLVDEQKELMDVLIKKYYEGTNEFLCE